MTRVLIGGIGNILLGDDGVGPYVVRSLEAAREFGEEVEIVDLGTPALDLIYNITSYSKADLLKHAPPTRMDPHSPALSESLLATEMLGAGPKEVLLIAVAGGCYETSCTLSEPVRIAVDEVIRIILAKLDGIGVQSIRREAEPDIWWDRASLHVETLSS